MKTETNFKELALIYHKNLPERIWKYLTETRGLSEEIVHRYVLGWNGTRITIPIRNREEEVVSFRLARDPEQSLRSPKMLSMTGSSLELYGWDTLARNPERLVICEGEFDRLVLESRGIAAVTSTGGALSFKEEWIEPLKAVPAIYLCFDRDEAGRRGAIGLARLLPNAKIVELPEEVGTAGDVSDFFLRLGRSVEDFKEILTAARRPEEDGEPAREEAKKLSPELQSRLSRIKAAVSVVEVVGREVDLRKSGKTFLGLCPFHDDEHPSLSVTPKTGTYRCFACGAHGDAIDFVRARQGLSFSEALSYLDTFLP